jgi:hypothetical protein
VHVTIERFSSFFFSGQTISWAMLNPSVSPYKRSVQVGQESFSTNPAVRLYRYDANSGEVILGNYVSVYLFLGTGK